MSATGSGKLYLADNVTFTHITQNSGFGVDACSSILCTIIEFAFNQIGKTRSLVSGLVALAWLGSGAVISIIKFFRYLKYMQIGSEWQYIVYVSVCLQCSQTSKYSIPTMWWVWLFGLTKYKVVVYWEGFSKLLPHAIYA